MEEILITGITGFVGSHLADMCLAKGLRVHGLRRYHLSSMKNVKQIEKQIVWYDCDMLDPYSVNHMIKKIMPTRIFHMASQSFVSPSWDHASLYMDANYKMTVNLLNACLEAGINPKILIPGSGEEFGEVKEEELPITEKSELKPVNPYAVTKVAQDMIGYVYFKSYGLNIIRTRAFNHEGPRREKVFGIPWYAYQIAMIEKGLQKKFMEVGHLDDRRSFTHVFDMVNAYWLATEKCDPGELYLVGSENENDVKTFREALEYMISKSTSKGIDYKVVKKYVRPTQVPFLICNCEKFRKQTGWNPQFNFQRIIDDTLEFWRANT